MKDKVYKDRIETAGLIATEEFIEELRKDHENLLTEKMIYGVFWRLHPDSVPVPAAAAESAKKPKTPPPVAK